MDTLRRSTDDEYGISMIVCATEHKQLYILDHTGSSIIHKIAIPSVAAFMSIGGLYQVEYRILLACRDGKVYTIKNGELQGTIIELETQPSGLARIDKHIFVGSMDKKIHCFHLKGRKLFTIFLPAHITNMEPLNLIYSRKFKALIVGLDTGEVRIYKDKNIVNTI
jgi:Bardet-Biedl syndrome 1 protein